MLYDALLPLLGGIVIFFSFLGLGFLCRKAVGAKTEFFVSTTVALGIAVAVFILEVLSMFHAVTLASVLVLEAVGLAGLGLYGRGVFRGLSTAAKEPWNWVLFAIVAFLYLRSVSCVWFNPGDDIAGYLLVVEKVRQTGGLGQDPFLLYRLLAGPGAYLLLQTQFALQFGYYHLSLLESGYGVIIGALAAFEYARTHLSVRLAVVLSGATAAALAVTNPNFTPFIILAGLNIAMFVQILADRRRGVPEVFCMSLVAGAVLAMKVTVLPVLLIVAAMWLFADWSERRDVKRVALLGAVAVGGVLLLMAPGMYQLRQTAGTYLFPMLGIGYYGSAYGTLLYQSEGVTLAKAVHALFIASRGAPAVGLTALLTIAVVGLYWRNRARLGSADLIVLALALTSVPLMVVVSYATAAEEGAIRYALPLFVSADVICALWISFQLFGTGPSASASNRAFAILVVLVLGFTGIWTAAFLKQSYLDLKFLVSGNVVQARADQTRYFSVTPPLSIAAEEPALREAQSVVPPGATVLTYVARWNGLDFRRNPTWNIGRYPGGMSPPPGLPVDGTGALLRDYLRSVGVDYVIFQYAGPSPIVHTEAMRVAYSSPWDRSFEDLMIKGRPLFLRLMAVTPVLYKDGMFATLKVR